MFLKKFTPVCPDNVALTLLFPLLLLLLLSIRSLFSSTNTQPPTGGRSDALLVKASQRVPFHWADVTSNTSTRTMSIRFDEYGWEWSCSFPIHNVGEFSVRLRNAYTHARHLCRVEVVLVDSTLFVVFQVCQFVSFLRIRKKKILPSSIFDKFFFVNFFLFLFFRFYQQQQQTKRRSSVVFHRIALKT